MRRAVGWGEVPRGTRCEPGMSEQATRPAEPTVKMVRGEGYHESYANSVQIRASVWDFFLGFGTMSQTGPEEVTLEAKHGIYVSPQQAKALMRLLEQNLEQYERTFGAITLEPVPATGGPVN